MLDLILIILLIISLAKPDVLLAKKVREKANEDQKRTMVKNIRIAYGLMIAIFETLALTQYEIIDSTITIVVLVVLLILFIIFGIPAVKANREIMKNLNN